MTVKNELPPLPQAELEALRAYVAAQGLPAQVDAITSDAPLTVVSAGAGTGKTWTLAWRFVWTALTRQESHKILTLTFTQKAAAEMRSRIAELLKSLEPVLRAYPELSRRRDAALLMLDQAYISTIHGFGTRVIGEAGLSLPVEPSMKLISDAESSEFWDEAAAALDRLDAEWFCRGMDADFAEKARTLLADEKAADVISQWGAVAVADFAQNFESTMSDFGHTPQSILENAALPDTCALEKLRALLAREYRELALRLCKGFAAKIEGSGAFVNRWEDFLAKWSGNEPVSDQECFDFAKEGEVVVRGARGNLANNIKDIIEIALKDWRKKYLKLLEFERLRTDGWNAEETELRSCLLKLAWLCWRRWEHYKETRGAITFGDMISLAVEALARDSRYASRFAEVLVDEFQDTNEQQDKLLRRIRESAEARLFIVGDLKQSIYRFRHAEPTLFEKYIAEARNGGGRFISLTVSFRSSEAVLAAVNTRFEKIWKEKLGTDLNVPYEALGSPRGLERAKDWIDARQQIGLPVCEVITEQSNKSLSKVEARERLALRLAIRLSELRSQGAKVWGKNALRPLEWGDIAVLVPTRGYYGPLEKAFSDIAAPVMFIESKSFYDRPEIRDTCAFVAFLADPGDRTALAGFLCSPFSGLTQVEAQKILPGLTDENPLETLRKIRPGLAELLDSLIITARMRGPSAALAYFLTRGDLLDKIHPFKRANALANLRRAVLILDGYEKSVSTSPVGVAEYLRRALRNGAKDIEGSTEADGDAIRVMTAHSSKGLEFPFVVFFGLEKNIRGERGSLFSSRTLLAAASNAPSKWLRAKESPAPLSRSAPSAETLRKEEAKHCLLKKTHDFLEEQAVLEELQRQYYVVLTRARDGIILCGLKTASEPEKSFAAIETKTAPLPAPEDLPAPELIAEHRALNASAPRQQTLPGPSILLPRREYSLESVSATSWAQWQMCPAAWRMNYRQDLDLRWSSDPGNLSAVPEDLTSGTELGDAAHWIMYRWDFTDAGYERLLALSDGHLPPELRSIWRSIAAKRTLRSFLDGFSAPDGQILRARLTAAQIDGRLHREYPFRVALGDIELVGAVDAFWIEYSSDGKALRLCVRDYKTTKLPAGQERREEVDRFYAAQLRFYSLALKLSHPEYARLEHDLALWNLRSGSEQKLAPLTPDEECALCDRITAMAKQAVTEWTPNLAHCGGCMWRQNCLFRKNTAESAD